MLHSSELSVIHLFVFISEMTNQHMDVWNKAAYWQYSEQINNLKKLQDALANDAINAQARTHIAREITALILRLHANTFIQEDFKADDIYVKLVHQVSSFPALQDKRFFTIKTI